MPCTTSPGRLTHALSSLKRNRERGKCVCQFSLQSPLFGQVGSVSMLTLSEMSRVGRCSDSSGMGPRPEVNEPILRTYAKKNKEVTRQGMKARGMPDPRALLCDGRTLI